MDTFYDFTKKEVMDLHTTIYQKFNYEMKYIRPPKGEYSEQTVSYCNTLGYTTVMWSFAYDDWDEKKQGREEYAKNNPEYKNAIILYKCQKVCYHICI